MASILGSKSVILILLIQLCLSVITPALAISTGCVFMSDMYWNQQKERKIEIWISLSWWLYICPVCTEWASVFRFFTICLCANEVNCYFSRSTDGNTINGRVKIAGTFWFRVVNAFVRDILFVYLFFSFWRSHELEMVSKEACWELSFIAFEWELAFLTLTLFISVSV